MIYRLAARRRALLIYCQRYSAADRAWRVAQSEALAWFLAGRRQSGNPIGNPGSPLRSLFECREKALARLTVAHMKLRSARDRQIKRAHILALPPR